MAKWKEVHSALTGKAEFVNLDLVAKLTPHPQGTLISLAGLPNLTTLVKESPYEIVGAST